MIETYYDPFLVTMSMFVAIFSSYIALGLSSSVYHYKGYARAIWLISGSIAMGIGIWSMHFIGMLSFKMPGMAMSYDVTLLLLSIFIPIAASYLALYIVSHFNESVRTFLLGGLAMGVAIAGMHYTGMAAMKMHAKIVWNAPLVILSIFIAVIASIGALRISYRLRNEHEKSRMRIQLYGSILMGFAICGMHYTGMFAASFIHSDNLLEVKSGVAASSDLTLFVIIGTLLILGMALTGILVDRVLTQKTIAADKNHQLYEQAENAARALREERTFIEFFITSLTHDLKTPLTAAMLNAQILQKKATTLNTDEHKYINTIIENIRQTNRMIHDLLDVQQIRANQPLPLALEELNLSDLLKNIIQNLQNAYGDQFILKVPGNVVGTWDSRYIKRMVENLCGNAIKYRHPGTPIELALEEFTTEVKIRVHNIGDPISTDNIDNLFNIFHRAPSERNKRSQGWGIGLTLVKGVIVSHGGSIEVESALDQGTTFIVKLPKSHPSSQRSS